MKFLKSNFKLFIGILIGTLIAGGIVYAATSANQVSYLREGTNIKTVQDALNDLYTKNLTATCKIVSSQASVSSGTTINVDIGSYIIVTSLNGINATNAEQQGTLLKGGSGSGVDSWTTAFKATDTSVTITIDGGFKFSYIVIK